MKVRLSEYDENWGRMFEDEAQFLRELFGDEIIKFEHFGSTSVPGMKAKPVIDIMCLVKDINKIDAFNDRMRLLGYDVAGEWGIQGRRLFRKGGETRTHHIHVYQYDNVQIKRHLVFRNYLRTHPEDVERYSCLKEELAQRYEDTAYYSKAKKPFVNELEQRALNWFEHQET
ncbi:GrpB family protein [Solibacillus sp. MA9]|uniref:GrpB family protein n=1 Tax=Solibacillus palustris TaxID=2908203 RepID=A0ABS9UAY5_9BACL|nr:GrpB family protein [Solibacillus sp. MA9]MCH7321512.1 GrpB family protein [Solibacillus sp. MA9]